jgi:hypothetical protein
MNIKPHAFELNAKISNGYFKKQYNKKGNLGSDILCRIQTSYPILNINWVLTGNGTMLKRKQIIR